VACDFTPKICFLSPGGWLFQKFHPFADAGGFHFDPMLGSASLASLIRAVNTTPILQDRYDMRRKKNGSGCVVPEPLVSTLTLGNEKLEE
jgi:hypothetical protein